MCYSIRFTVLGLHPWLSAAKHVVYQLSYTLRCPPSKTEIGARVFQDNIQLAYGKIMHLIHLWGKIIDGYQHKDFKAVIKSIQKKQWSIVLK